VEHAKAQRIPVHIEPSPAFDRLVPGGNHQGVIAFVAAKAYSSTQDILQLARQKGEPPFLVILDGVEDPQNLGAIIRTAEAAGVHGIFIPERRAAGLTSIVAKISAGALEHMRVARVVNLSRLIEGAASYGLTEWSRRHRRLSCCDMTGPIAFVFREGAEHPSKIAQECDGWSDPDREGQIPKRLSRGRRDTLRGVGSEVV
jgi:23S rRNA (guanosine2251-2'-O)-methyltransferase